MIDWHEVNVYWRKRMPILNWLPRYDVQHDLKFDLIAGFTVAVMLVPQEMSFAALMGVPAQYGLYTAATAPLLYPLFGSSRALSVANASEGSLLVGVMLRAAEIQSMEERVATGILLTFFTGIIMICSGILHQGGIVSFFSRTSMNAYITATAFLIVTSQLTGWLGIKLLNASTLTIFTVFDIIAELHHTNTYSLALGIFSIGFLTVLKKLKTQLHGLKALVPSAAAGSKVSNSDAIPVAVAVAVVPSGEENVDDSGVDVVEIQLNRSASSSSSVASVQPMPMATVSVPAQSPSLIQAFLTDKPHCQLFCNLLCDGSALIVCVLGMMVGAYVGEDAIALTGVVPKGLPAPVFPPSAFGSVLPWDRLQSIVVNAATIALIFFMSSVATGSKLANKDGYEIAPNQELLGLGFANLGASFFQGMPSSAGMSRSAVNSQSAHTPLASMITALLVATTLLFLTGPLYYLPQAPLAAIIILSALTLIDFAEPKWLRTVRRDEFYVWVGAFVGTLAFGLIRGLAISIAASLFTIMAQSKKPHVFVLGQCPDGSFDDAEAPNAVAKELLDVVIVRMEHALYFGNTTHFIHGLERKLQAAKARSRIVGVVVDGSRMNSIDATAIHALKEYHQKLEVREQQLTFANLRQETAESLLASGLWKSSGSQGPQRLLTGDLAKAVAFLRRPYDTTL